MQTFESDDTAFQEALRLSEIALNPLSVENTSEKSFQKAELSLRREARAHFVGSFFGSSTRSNKYVPLVEHTEDRNSISFWNASSQ